MLREGLSLLLPGPIRCAGNVEGVAEGKHGIFSKQSVFPAEGLDESPGALCLLAQDHAQDLWYNDLLLCITELFYGK
jgi:hypothetical protein